jgi:hypothetical protein
MYKNLVDEIFCIMRLKKKKEKFCLFIYEGINVILIGCSLFFLGKMYNNLLSQLFKIKNFLKFFFFRDLLIE